MADPTPENTDAQVAIFQTYLRRSGLKLTTQRNAIARKVFGTHRHFSAEELIAVLRKGRRPVSKATVYRTLALLEEAQLINSIDFQRGYKFYEHTQQVGHEHHEHIVCVDCYQIVEFRDQELEAVHERIARELNYTVISHTYKIFGLCPRCRLKPERAPTAERITR